MDEIALQIYNTKTRKKQRIHMYTCAPYHFAHIGNFRTITYFGMSQPKK